MMDSAHGTALDHGKGQSGVGTPAVKPSARLWLLAIGELAAAALIARLVLSDNPPLSGHHHMAGMTMPSPSVHWNWLEFSSIAVILVATAWWWRTRHAAAALIGAVGIATLVTSEPVRILATQSHLVAMAAMELVLVAAPLAVLAALPHPRASTARRATWKSPWTLPSCGAAVLYGGSILTLHLPSVHQLGMTSGVAPIWIPLALVAMALAYWAAILRTSGRVPLAIRRAALVGTQEVAAFVGLLAIFGAWAPMSDASPLGIGQAWDQRLGGLLMMITCAAVAIPAARRLSAESDAPPR